MPGRRADLPQARRGLGARTRRRGKAVKPTGLGAAPLELPADDDPRQALADWMTAKDNPFFARSLVNRYWKHFFGRGLVDPEDDMRVTNPADQPGTARRAGQALHRQRFRSEGPGADDLHARTTYQLSCRAERLQPGRQAELLALLSQAAERPRCCSTRSITVTGTQDRLRRPARRHAGRAVAGQRVAIVLPDGLRPAGIDQRLRVRAVERSQPGAEPAPAEFLAKCRASSRPPAAARPCWPATRRVPTREDSRDLSAVSIRASRGRRSRRSRWHTSEQEPRIQQACLRGHPLGAGEYQGVFV